MEIYFHCRKQASKHPRKLRRTNLRMHLIVLFTSLISSFSPPLFANQDQIIEIIYPAVNSEISRDFDPYFIKLLHLGMEKSGREYHITPQPMSMISDGRSELMLKRNQYNLHWLNTNEQRENGLVPIRIPLFKGLIGWRLLFIKKNKKEIFSSINTLEELRPYLSGHGHDWPDVQVFKFNHLPVSTSASWEGLFKMLHAERIDYFPRSIVEIWREQRLFADINLHVEDHLALHYPAAYYFFTNKQNTALAEALTQGLNIAIADGSFDKVFLEHFGEFIKKAELERRTIIELHNPHFQSIENPAYWYNPR